RDPESGLALDQSPAGAGSLLVAVPRRGRAVFHILSRDGRSVPLVFGGEEKGGDKGGLPTSLALRSVRLPAAGALAGQVVAGKARRPVPGAYVWPAGDSGAYVRADARGRFRIQGAPAYRWVWLGATAPGHSMEETPFRVKPRAGTDLPAILLEPRLGLAGVVVDGQGHPLAGAEVRTSVNETRQGSDWSQPVATDSAGRFLIPNLTAGVVDVRVTHPGFAPAIRTAMAGEPSLRVVLRPGHTAFGSVEDEDEKPLAGVAVELKRTEDPTVSAITDRWIYRTTTGCDGSFELANLPAGSFTLLLDSPDFGRGWSQVTIPEEEERVDLGSFWPEHPRVTGRVVDPQGKPIARARIWSQGRWNVIRERKAALTDEAGTFSFPAPDEGSVRLEVQREGFGMVQREVDPKAGPIEVVLHPAAKVSGRVLSPEGKGIAGARIKYTPLYLQRTQPWYTTDSEGHFELPEQAPGEIELEVTALGYLPGEKVRITVQAGQSVEDVELVLSPGVALAGLVLAEDGEPLFGASVVNGGEPSQLTKTDPEGRYVLSGLKPGEQGFQVTFQGFKDAVQTLEIRPGENRLDWALVRYERHPVRGRVLAVDGSPAAGALVIFNDGEDRAPLRVLSGPGGSFEILLEELGYAYTAHAEKDGIRSGEVSVLVQGAPVEGLDLQLAAPASLSGRIVGLSDKWPASLPVLVKVQTPSFEIVREASGRERYQVTGLLPGQWHVTARFGDEYLRRTVTVPPKGGNIEFDLDFTRIEVLVRVLDLEGQPVPCKVWFQNGGSGAPGADGTFTIGLMEGTYGINILSPTHELAEGQGRVSISWQESAVEIRVRPKAEPQPPEP
ncbi:MAG TPA: carboxypeptidase-like regulatory domain-containing protein, partial [Thermoanaerobaculia bacterium]|nr:carboxypeptidase-like regulatory domain-containing protein [Thermoanaerobaculia bacterium]